MTDPNQPPQQPQPPYDHKAQMAASKAYKKAQRPWYAKKRFLIPGGVLAIAVIAGAAGGSSGDLEATDSDSSESATRDSQPAKKQGKKKKPAPQPDSTDGRLVMEVKSTESRSANSITYFDPKSDGFQQSQENGAALPFRKTWEGVDDLPMGWNMNAQQNGGGQLTCIIRLDGEVIARNQSSGSYAVVSCSP